MRQWATGIAAAAATAVLMLACGSGGGLDTYSRKLSVDPAKLPLEVMVGTYRVPPDRALVAVTIRVADAKDAATAAQSLRDEIDAVAGAMPVDTGCTVRPFDYQPPEGGKTYYASTDLVLDIPFVGLTTVRERMDRLDSCLNHVNLRQDLYRDRTEKGVGRGTILLVVDDPQSHFAALTGILATQQEAAASLATIAQIHPGDRRCVPTGEVVALHRSLDGVVLDLQRHCRIPGEAEPG